MKLPDAFIATVGTLFTIMAYLMMAFGPSSWDYSTDPDILMYISAALMFNSLITVTIRSQCTKEVEKSEIGKLTKKLILMSFNHVNINLNFYLSNINMNNFATFQFFWRQLMNVF